MPIQTSPITALRPDGANHGRADIDLLGLSCGEIAVALQIAGLPARWRRMPTSGLIDLAMAGIATIGLDEVLRIHAESRRVRNAQATTGTDTSRERAQLERIWPSAREQAGRYRCGVDDLSSAQAPA